MFQIYYGLDDEFDKKEVFDCILDKDSPFLLNLNIYCGIRIAMDKLRKLSAVITEHRNNEIDTMENR